MDYSIVIDENNKLKKENEYLKELLKKHNIKYELTETKPLTTNEKLNIYKSFFRGRKDVFTEKYLKKDGKKAYTIVCCNKGSALCLISSGKNKPCLNCPNKKFAELNDEFLLNHMMGKKSYGIYPIINNDKCYFLAIDFDDAEFDKAAIAYKNECSKLGIDVAIELSQSGNGTHVWIFFDELVEARKARALGDLILLNAMSENKNISFKSYDRFFPSQDFIDDNGYGNCIALPLQGSCVRNKTSVFVDDNFEIFPNQIEFLSNVKKISKLEFDLLFNTYINDKNQLEINPKLMKKISVNKSDFPDLLQIVIQDDIYLSKDNLSSKALIIIKRLAVLYNPEFYEKQAKRISTYNINRIIELYKEDDCYMSLPRGCLSDLKQILNSINVSYKIIDKRVDLQQVDFNSDIKLYDNQKEAVDELLKYDSGLLIAPTGSGKTIMGIEIINRIKKPTLILVDQIRLIDQWKERLESFSSLCVNHEKIPFGVLSSSKKKINGLVDIASIKSISDSLDLYDKYELIIGDEIHHIASRTYESVIRKFKARYVYGLTATPKRSDHLEKIVYKSIGDIRYTLCNYKQPFNKLLKPRFTKFKNDNKYTLMNYADICSELYKDNERNEFIINDIVYEYNNNKNIIVLTERNEHVDILYEMLSSKCNNVYKIKGIDKTKYKKEFNNEIKLLNSGYIIVSTDKYLGEGFDLPSLNTMFLTMPFKWNGKLSQALGRINRISDNKTETLVYDYVDIKIGMFAHQFQLRLKGYKNDGYTLLDVNNKNEILFSYNNYKKKLFEDIENGDKVVFYCNFYINECMYELLSLNDNIQIVTDLEVNTFKEIIKNHSEINAIIIDNKILWYGSINPFSWSKKDDTILRLLDNEYIKNIFDNEI